MVIKKKHSGGVIKKIRDNRRNRKEKRAIRKDAAKESATAGSRLNNRAVSTPKAEVRTPRVGNATPKLWAGEKKGVTAPAARRPQRKIGADPSGVVARERERERARREANERNRAASRNEEMARQKSAPQKKH